MNFRTINAGQYIGIVTKGRECRNFDGDPDAGGGFCTVAPCGDWTGLYKLQDGGGNQVLSFEWAYGSVCKAAGMQDPRGLAANLSTGTWYHVAASFDSATSTRRLFVNGAQVATDTLGACLEAAIPHYTRLGTDSNLDFLDGQLDEVRVSFAARSNAWITAGYNNQSNPTMGGFYSSISHETRRPLDGGRHRLPGAQPLRRRPGHLLPALDRQHGALLDRQRNLHGHERVDQRVLPRRRLAERQPRARRPDHDRRDRLHGA